MCVFVCVCAAQLREKEQSILPLEMQVQRGVLETGNLRAQLDGLQAENANLDNVITGLKGVDGHWCCHCVGICELYPSVCCLHIFYKDTFVL